MAFFTLGRLYSRSKCGQMLQVTSKHVRRKHQEPVRVEYKNYGTQFTLRYDDPCNLVKSDLKDIHLEIREELGKHTNNRNLLSAATYYFDGRGKAVRPVIITLMARAINCHLNIPDLLPSQRKFAIIVEMLHSASLVHDDIIDKPDLRRGKPSINVILKDKQAIMAGDFVIGVLFSMTARLKNDDVTVKMMRIFSDIVQGELIQEGMIEDIENLTQYLNKTYFKAASLFSNSLKAVAGLGGADDKLSEVAFQYGRNIGIVYQLIDDLLDYVSTSDIRGKPATLDLKSGLATAPVLFACEQFPELNVIIKRRFKEAGDVEKAFEMVHKSKGLEQTRLLAEKYCLDAVRLANTIHKSPYQKELTTLPDLIINREKQFLC